MPTVDVVQNSLAAGEPLTATASRAPIWILLEYNEVLGANALEHSNLPERVKKFLLTTSANLPNARFQFIKQNGSSEGIRLYIAQAHPINPLLYRFKLESYDDLLDIDIEAIAT